MSIKYIYRKVLAPSLPGSRQQVLSSILRVSTLINNKEIIKGVTEESLAETLEKGAKVLLVNASFIGPSNKVPSLADLVKLPYASLLRKSFKGLDKVTFYAIGFTDWKEGSEKEVIRTYEEFGITLITDPKELPEVTLADLIESYSISELINPRVIAKFSIGNETYLIRLKGVKGKRYHIEVHKDNFSNLSSLTLVASLVMSLEDNYRIDVTLNKNKAESKVNTLVSLLRKLLEIGEEKDTRVVRSFIEGLLLENTVTFSRNLQLYPISSGAYNWLQLVLQKGSNYNLIIANHYANLSKTVPFLTKISQLAPILVVPGITIVNGSNELNSLGEVHFNDIAKVLGDDWKERIKNKVNKGEFEIVKEKLSMYGGKKLITYERPRVIIRW